MAASLSRARATFPARPCTSAAVVARAGGTPQQRQPVRAASTRVAFPVQLESPASHAPWLASLASLFSASRAERPAADASFAEWAREVGLPLGEDDDDSRDHMYASHLADRLAVQRVSRFAASDSDDGH